MTPDPRDPADPGDPGMSSKSGIFIMRVVTLGMDGALAQCFSDFFEDASHETQTFETILMRIVQTGKM